MTIGEASVHDLVEPRLHPISLMREEWSPGPEPVGYTSPSGGVFPAVVCWQLTHFAWMAPERTLLKFPRTRWRLLSLKSK